MIGNSAMTLSFNSYAFIFAFLPLCVTIWYILPVLFRTGERQRSARRLLIGAASFLFLASAGWYSLAVFLCSLLANGVFLYLLTDRSSLSRVENQDEKCASGSDLRSAGPCRTVTGYSVLHKKAVFITDIAANILFLLWFKYAGSLFSLPIVFPLAISFYTFQQTALAVEVYKGDMEAPDVGTYILYAVYFPKLLQGPLASPEELIPQLRHPERASADGETILRCIFLFVIGLFKKVILADALQTPVDYGFSNLRSLLWSESWILVLTYPLQLYLDFSGYCDMSMAVSGMLGIRLPLNFNKPMRSVNISDFWRRWHITLTQFFQRYVYYPLGGSRCSLVRTCGNIMIVFALSGLWHGNTAGYLIWGLLNGALSVLFHLVRRAHRDPLPVPAWISRALMYLFFCLSLIPFRAQSLGDAGLLISRLLQKPWFVMHERFSEKYELTELWYAIKVTPLAHLPFSRFLCMWILLGAALLLCFQPRTAQDIAGKTKLTPAFAVLMGILFVWSASSVGKVTQFAYFNF